VVVVLELVLDVGETTVLVVAPTEVVVVMVVEVASVEDAPHGHWKVTLWPTAFFRHTSASVAVVPPSPFVSQMHAGSQVSEPTAARKMNKQSLATGVAPLLSGWPQSASAANALSANDENRNVSATSRSNRSMPNSRFRQELCKARRRATPPRAL